MFDYSVLCSDVNAAKRNQVVSLLSENDIGYKLTSQMPFQMRAKESEDGAADQKTGPSSASRQVRYTISVKERDLKDALKLIKNI
nr:hypothetical protein [Shuttleworthia satelles]